MLNCLKSKYVEKAANYNTFMVNDNKMCYT